VHRPAKAAKPAEKRGDDGRSGQFNRSGRFGTGFIPQLVPAAATSAAITSRAWVTGCSAAQQTRKRKKPVQQFINRCMFCNADEDDHIDGVCPEVNDEEREP